MKKLMKHFQRICVACFLVFLSACDPWVNDVILTPSEPDNPEIISVLDGDTLLVGDTILRLRGIDAPEMPPHSRCWAEAALAGHAKVAVERYVLGGNRGRSEYGGWRITDPSGTDEHGHLIGSLKSTSGEDLADILVVYGYAARSDKWDWCAEGQDLRNRVGPNLWYPPDDRLDDRVID